MADRGDLNRLKSGDDSIEDVIKVADNPALLDPNKTQGLRHRGLLYDIIDTVVGTFNRLTGNQIRGLDQRVRNLTRRDAIKPNYLVVGMHCAVSNNVTQAQADAGQFGGSAEYLLLKHTVGTLPAFVDADDATTDKAPCLWVLLTGPEPQIIASYPAFVSAQQPYQVGDVVRDNQKGKEVLFQALVAMPVAGAGIYNPPTTNAASWQPYTAETKGNNPQLTADQVAAFPAGATALNQLVLSQDARLIAALRLMDEGYNNYMYGPEDTGYPNTYPTYFGDNVIGSYSNGNTFEQGANQNVIATGATNNLFKEGCNSNKLGVYVTDCVFGVGVYNCEFENYLYQSVIENNCTYLKIGKDCKDIIVGEHSNECIVGDACAGITFGKNCDNVKVYDTRFGYGPTDTGTARLVIPDGTKNVTYRRGVVQVAAVTYDDTALKAAIYGRFNVAGFKGLNAYKAGDEIVRPDGLARVAAKVDFMSTANYDAANWLVTDAVLSLQQAASLQYPILLYSTDGVVTGYTDIDMALSQSSGKVLVLPGQPVFTVTAENGRGPLAIYSNGGKLLVKNGANLRLNAGGRVQGLIIDFVTQGGTATLEIAGGSGTAATSAGAVQLVDTVIYLPITLTNSALRLHTNSLVANAQGTGTVYLFDSSRITAYGAGVTVVAPSTGTGPGPTYDDTALKAAIYGRFNVDGFKGLNAYKAGDEIIRPDGLARVAAKVDFTSTANYDAANWLVTDAVLTEAQAKNLYPLAAPIIGYLGDKATGYATLNAAVSAGSNSIFLNQDITINTTIGTALVHIFSNGRTIHIADGKRLGLVVTSTINNTNVVADGPLASGLLQIAGSTTASSISDAVQVIDSRIDSLTVAAAGNILVLRGDSVIENLIANAGTNTTYYLYDLANVVNVSGPLTLIDRRPGTQVSGPTTPATTAGLVYAGLRYESAPRIGFDVTRYGLRLTAILDRSNADYINTSEGCLVAKEAGFYGIKGHVHMVFGGEDVYSEVFVYLNNDPYSSIVSFNQITPKRVNADLILGSEQFSTDVYLPAGTLIKLGYYDQSQGSVTPRTSAPANSCKLTLVRLS